MNREEAQTYFESQGYAVRSVDAGYNCWAFSLEKGKARFPVLVTYVDTLTFLRRHLRIRKKIVDTKTK